MIALDSSVIVAALRSVDQRQRSAARALQRAIDSEGGALVPLHVVVESYSLLTRMPLPYRLSPADTLTLLRKTLADVKLASLSARSLWPLLDHLSAADLGGGLTYDAVILRSAEDAGATALLTFNERDYALLSPRIAILAPE